MVKKHSVKVYSKFVSIVLHTDFLSIFNIRIYIEGENLFLNYIICLYFCLVDYKHLESIIQLF